jgi:hypothetical protein
MMKTTISKRIGLGASSLLLKSSRKEMATAKKAENKFEQVMKEK